MKRGTKLLGLLSFLLILVVIFMAIKASNLKQTGEGETAPVGDTVLAVSSNDVTDISWMYNGAEQKFVKDASGVWKYSEDDAFPVDESAINSMISALANVTSSKVIDAPEDLAQYGLADAPVKAVVNLSDGSGKILTFGDQSAISGEYYMSIGDGKVYMVDALVVTPFKCSLADVVMKEEIPVIDNITRFYIDGENIDVEIVKQEGGFTDSDSQYTWFWKTEDGEYLPLDTAKALTFMSNITDLSLGKCLYYNASSLDLYNCRLDNPYFTATVEYEGGIFVFEVGTTDGLSLCGRIAGSNMIYEVDNSLAVTLLYTPYEDIMPDELMQ